MERESKHLTTETRVVGPKGNEFHETRLRRKLNSLLIILKKNYGKIL